jgi:hypothetical protein
MKGNDTLVEDEVGSHSAPVHFNQTCCAIEAQLCVFLEVSKDTYPTQATLDNLKLPAEG